MKIHILGPSGSGTTTLGKALAEELQIKQFDSDAFFWAVSELPFTVKRPASERVALLKSALSKHDSWILSGAVVPWGDFLIPEFTLVIYKYIKQDVRVSRLVKREKERYGDRIKPNGDFYEHYLEFMEYVKSYEDGSINIRSLLSQNKWLEMVNCKVLRIEEELDVESEVELVKKELGV